jgi:hypothetical protein
MDAGTPDHEASITITLPGANPTVTDWFCGPIARYMDGNNHVSARLLYQSNSPEIKLWQTIGGSPTFISAVNLGANNLVAGSTHTLALAVKGQECAAYLDGVLRLQAITTLLTGNKAGFGTLAPCEGQPTYDDWELKEA